MITLMQAVADSVAQTGGGLPGNADPLEGLIYTLIGYGLGELRGWFSRRKAVKAAPK